MFVRRVLGPVIWSLLAIVFAFSTLPVAAQDIQHFGKNRLEFAPVASDSLSDATGTGVVDYEGGKEPSSQWRASFRFTGLEAGVSYAVVIKGRFGKLDSSEADSLTTLCSFTSDEVGDGGCFWYFRGLARLNLVQLRVGDEGGPRVVEASRAGGPGSITTEPNRFSPGGEIPARKRSRDGKNSR